MPHTSPLWYLWKPRHQQAPELVPSIYLHMDLLTLLDWLEAAHTFREANKSSEEHNMLGIRRIENKEYKECKNCFEDDKRN